MKIPFEAASAPLFSVTIQMPKLRFWFFENMFSVASSCCVTVTTSR